MVGRPWVERDRRWERRVMRRRQSLIWEVIGVRLRRRYVLDVGRWWQPFIWMR